VYSMSYMLGSMDWLRPADGEGSEGVESELDETAYFDTRLYDATMPWGLFNVLIIERQNGVAYRVAVGRCGCVYGGGACRAGDCSGVDN
jgi:hypothetical protein